MAPKLVGVDRVVGTHKLRTVTSVEMFKYILRLYYYYYCQWRTEEGLGGLEHLPLAYGLRNKRARMRQNMVFSTKNTKKFSGDSPLPRLFP